MKKIIFTICAVAIAAAVHFSLQSFVQKTIVSELDKRTGEFTETSGHDVSYTLQKLRFDYFTLSTVVEGIQLQVGQPSLAIIDIQTFRKMMMTNESHLKDINVLVAQSEGGAVSLVQVESLMLDGDQNIDGEKWSYFDGELKGTQISDVFYSNFLSPNVSSVVKEVVSKDGFDLRLSLRNAQDGEVSPASFGLSVKDMFEIDVDMNYEVQVKKLESTPVDPSTGKPLQLAVTESVSQFVHDFSITLKDEGVRDALFQYGSSFKEEPGLTDAQEFKDIIVDGLDTYVNQVVIEPILPLEAMNNFVSWVDDGGQFEVSVGFNDPVTVDILWEHLFGFPHVGIYEKSVVETEVK